MPRWANRAVQQQRCNRRLLRGCAEVLTDERQERQPAHPSFVVHIAAHAQLLRQR